MKTLSTFTGRLHKLARYIERPHLFRLRQEGVLVDAYLQLTRPWLRELGFATILDIGANVGQFARVAAAAFPRARLYSFEPLSDCFQALQANLAGHPQFRAFNVGLGRESGQFVFERNDFTASSSFLKMADVHKREFPQTQRAREVTVRVERLDDLARQLILEPPLLVKLDVQGYEEQVLLGGERTLRGAKLLIVETSFERIYEGQALFDAVYQRLVNWGFVYAGAMDQLVSPQDGRMLQADSIFLQKGGYAKPG